MMGMILIETYQKLVNNKTKKVGRFLKKNKKIVFDEILCSPALRTKRTLDIISVFLKTNQK